MVVDDSLFMRMLVSDMLNSDPDIEVIDTAKNGREAVEKTYWKRPDCITLDLVMPGWNGLTTLENIMIETPTPVIVLSAHSKKNAAITIKCLNAGAVGFVLKPSGELSLDIKDVKPDLLKQVKAASKVNLASIKLPKRGNPKRSKCRLVAVKSIIVVGASTGGPQILETIIGSLPTTLSVPIIVVQHMPSKYFTESLAEHLNRVSDLEVKVAEDGEVLRPGKVYLSPGGFQTQVSANHLRNLKNMDEQESVFIHVTEDKLGVLSHSIDTTMKSIADVYGENTIGIILSGMGDDGCDGMTAIKAYGGKTIVQDESSLIFGMPKAVIDAGVADKVLPAWKIVEVVVEILEGK